MTLVFQAVFELADELRRITAQSEVVHNRCFAGTVVRQEHNECVFVKLFCAQVVQNPGLRN